MAGITEILLTIYVLLSIIAILIYAPFWILGGLSKRRRRPAERGMRCWPLIAVPEPDCVRGNLRSLQQ